MKAYNNKYLNYKLFIMFNFKNIIEFFKIQKIILNFGVKEAVFNTKKILVSFLALQIITKKKSLLRYSKKPVMILKVRKGMVIGCKTTLRKKSLNEFHIFLLENILFNFKDIRGLSLSSVNKNNITLCLEDLFIFKKLEFFFDIFSELPPLNITLVTTTNNKQFNLNFLKVLGYKIDYK